MALASGISGFRAASISAASALRLRHRSSVTLEEPFWQGFREIASKRRLSLNALAAEIDAARDPEIPLASAIRVYVFQTLRAG
ncbi:MAG: ribbon-helix-helix domain-containing protein [Pseudomonadota bacterium]